MELSHQLLDPTRGVGLARLLRCIVLRIVGLLALETQRAVHTAGSFGDVLGAALVLAPPASSVSLAMERAACNSGLGAAQVLAPPAPAMRDAAMRAACSSGLEAVLSLAPPASTVRDAVARVA